MRGVVGHRSVPTEVLNRVVSILATSPTHNGAQMMRRIECVPDPLYLSHKVEKRNIVTGLAVVRIK